MLVAAIVIASLLAGFGAWTVYRRYGRATGDAAAAADRPKGRDAAAPAVTDNSRVESANSLLTERLWKLAFAAPSHAQSLEAEHVEIRKFVSAILECDTCLSCCVSSKIRVPRQRKSHAWWLMIRC
jgi:hypothetical protein